MSKASKASESTACALKSASRKAAYALAAGAAAGACERSDAAIQYFEGFFDVNQGFQLGLYFNDDGYYDLYLSNYVFLQGNYQGAFVPFFPGKIVGFQSGTSGRFYASALQYGDPIAPETLGPSGIGALAYGANNPEAQFNAATDGYIGFAFPIGPTDLYYAWIRVDIDNAAGTFFVKDWAYEDQTGVGILAGDRGTPPPILGDFDGDFDVDGADFITWQRGVGGEFNASDLVDWQENFGLATAATPSAGVVPEPGTLGLLAAGAAGVAILRRRRGQP